MEFNCVNEMSIEMSLKEVGLMMKIADGVQRVLKGGEEKTIEKNVEKSSEESKEVQSDFKGSWRRCSRASSDRLSSILERF